MTDFSAHSSGKPPDVVISMLRDLLQFLSEAVFSGGCGSERRLELTLVGDTGTIASRVAYCRSLDAPALVIGKFVEALLVEGSLEIAKNICRRWRPRIARLQGANPSLQHETKAKVCPAIRRLVSLQPSSRRSRVNGRADYEQRVA